MKKIKCNKKYLAIYCLIFWGLSLHSSAFKIIENPLSPLGEKFGRIVKLEKVAIAHDEKGDYLFKNPYYFLSIEDGAFFLIDNGKILKFSKEGKFEKIVVSKGEGPGEATYLHQIFKRGNELIVNTGFMGKLMVFDFDGNLKGEFREKKSPNIKIEELGFTEIVYKILAYRDDRSLIVLCPSLFRSKKKETGKDKVFLISEQNEWIENLFGIPIDSIEIDVNGEKFMLQKLSLVHASDSQFLYYSNTERYEIKKYCINDNKLELIWKRKYNPVLIPGDMRDKVRYGATFVSGNKNGEVTRIKVPTPKHFHDIKQLFVVKSYIWALTSTFLPEKGLLVDVYNQEGKYVDNFFLKIPGISNMASMSNKGIHIFSGYLYTKETDEEGNFLVVKYKILDS